MPITRSNRVASTAKRARSKKPQAGRAKKVRRKATARSKAARSAMLRQRAMPSLGGLGKRRRLGRLGQG